MPLIEYKCSNCNLLVEKLLYEAAPDFIKCERCSREAEKLQIPTSISLVRSEMDNSPIDNAIGREADKRWEDIHNRQDIRNPVLLFLDQSPSII